MATLTQKDLLAEILSRKSTPPPNFLDPSFTKQNDFILDPSRLKVAFCTRRAGKSYGAGLYLVKEAYENPGVSCLYIALTRSSAKSIFWKDVLKRINSKFKLGIVFNESALTATLPNGSIIYLLGVNANEEEKEKLLGQKYRLAVIDESASYTINLRDVVYKILKPAMMDLQGTIVMIGTPGNLTKGLFYDITTGKEPGWSVHRWTGFDNPHMSTIFQKEIDEMRVTHPLYLETPEYKQMYLGQWVTDETKLIYRWDPRRNEFETLPQGEWNYVLGVDLGYNDPTGFVVAAYCSTDPCLYILHSFKKSKMDVTDVAAHIKSLQLKYDFNVIVVDGANKQAVEEIKNRHGIPLKSADKVGKFDFIEILNGELIQAKIKAHPVYAAGLIDEWQGLIWNERSSKREENPNCPNHLADAFLYAWRWTYSYLATEVKSSPKVGTPAWFSQEEKRMIEEAEARYREQQDELEW